MKRFLYIILAAIFITLTINSCGGDAANTQKTISYPEFYRGCNHVKVLLSKGQLREAMDFYDDLSKQVPYALSRYYYTFAQKAAEANDCANTHKYLKLAMENGKEYGAMTSNIQKIKNCDDAIKDLIAKEKEIHDKHFNYDYKNGIDSLFAKDKRYRDIADWTHKEEHDSIFKKQFLDMYRRYGYPSEKIIGTISAQNARLLMLRLEPGKGNKDFLPIFREGYEKGFINARNYAGFTDRRIARGINYVAPYYYEMPTQDYSQMIEVERAEIDRRRDSIGLEAIPRRPQ